MLQCQYERWQPRARYKHCHDPTIDDVKKLCYSMRKAAKEERCLFHYNGHGVPQPTKNGEIWVFNRVRFHIFTIFRGKMICLIENMLVDRRLRVLLIIRVVSLKL